MIKIYGFDGCNNCKNLTSMLDMHKKKLNKLGDDIKFHYTEMSMDELNDMNKIHNCISAPIVLNNGELVTGRVDQIFDKLVK